MIRYERICIKLFDNLSLIYINEIYSVNRSNTEEANEISATVGHVSTDYRTKLGPLSPPFRTNTTAGIELPPRSTDFRASEGTLRVIPKKGLPFIGPDRFVVCVSGALFWLSFGCSLVAISRSYAP